MANVGKILKGGVEAAKIFCKTNAAEIAVGCGIASMAAGNISTALVQSKITAARETYKELGKLEVAKHVLPYYIPTAVLTVGGGALIVCGMRAKNKQLAALGATCALAGEAIKSYKSEIKSLVSETEAGAIDENVAKSVGMKTDESEKITKAAPYIREDGLYLCMDGITGQVFWSNEDKIARVYEWVNKQVTQDMYCSVNDFLCELELNTTCDGDGRGWFLDKPGYINSVHYITRYVPCDTMPYVGRPVLLVNPTVDPAPFE